MPTATEQRNGATMITQSMISFYRSRKQHQTPHCMRDCWSIPIKHKKSGWKIDRGRRSEREMLSARAQLRGPVSNSTEILHMKAHNRAVCRPNGST